MSRSVAIVTGAAGDIGRAIARRLADDHDIVLLADIDPAAAEAAARELGPAERFVAVKVDVTSEADTVNMAKVAAGLGVVRTLVNNAGAARAVSLHDTTPEIWRADNALNLEAAFLCFRAAEDMLKASKGSLINIASVNGMAVFGHPAYSAAKAGLLHFTRLVAVEYGKFGIRANAVAPGTVRTQAWEARASANPNVFEEARRWYPLQRVVDPADVANAVGFLASPLAASITGVCLPVDCGLTAGQAELAHTFSQSDHY
ncbi:SDR family oxidoreductase [Agrobacterium sp. SHOUNA12C]|uniref:Oxidoreductase protein n=2 Tax=Rhizobium rhizogenes TaxID=359 RepID=B9J705_RHIR8|nr:MULTISPECIES: SDR family oxidoreductase [Rhizobium]ACM25111.1 oxidoreductase protein [Rhizobium rhizogenes K84]KAA6487136.1 SDR family oxidoreductase [Agrobacterium sp. ICMP 7243]MCJ9723817.1 SDR family oxidoreductase [Agrobacterium sp. BETTINA12B]MCJ9760188.1 SDR family oxidoreductase [Agrobacterium sp. SHOUNA12C]OCI97747.1 short-chain dehydrogenase [Agrobacterium sp. 13-626]OCJ21470.1 short-chain dehydrogenase [Agrobacterium sp. B131/95]OCJ27089.1 short-chain dehydrogenase [Agrobacteriu